jgi:hypothetical protein
MDIARRFSSKFRNARRGKTIGTTMISASPSRVSRRAILFLFALIMGIPGVVRSATLDDSAREFARKIAAALPSRENVAWEIHNLSSLPADEAARVEQTLKAELQNQNVSAPDGGAPIAVVVTLSENVNSYVWTAEIHRAENLQIAVMSFPRPLENRIVSNAVLTTLHGEKIWEWPERIVDVTFALLPNHEQRMIVLLPDGLLITKAEPGATFKKVEFPPAAANVDREPAGNLRQVGNRVESVLNGQECDVDFDAGTLVRCYTPPAPENVPPVEAAVSEKPPYGDQAWKLPGICGIGDAVLASGRGDYTQPDSARVFENKTAISNELNLPGPVLKFSEGADTQFVTAIVRNLKDGDYEVYRLFTSCGQ